MKPDLFIILEFVVGALKQPDPQFLWMVACVDTSQLLIYPSRYPTVTVSALLVIGWRLLHFLMQNWRISSVDLEEQKG
jgi:hypothetical protein